MRRGHDQERTEQFEYARLIAYCAIKPYLEKGVTIDEFMPLASDEHERLEEETVADMLAFASAVAEAYKENKQLTKDEWLMTRK